jgi:hypothetical protein
LGTGAGNGAWARLFGAIGMALALKTILLCADVIPFNADEAVVALMARHILQGEREVFFYGQAYLGTLDAWLIAGAFRALGESVLAIRIVQAALYAGTLLTTYWLGRRIYPQPWIAITATLFLALPTVNVTLYTTASLGGYGETLLIGNALLLFALHVAHAANSNPSSPSSLALSSLALSSLVLYPLSFGFLSGLGFWTFPLVLVYLVPAAVYVVVAQRARLSWQTAGRWIAFGLGFAAGAAPWWWYTLTVGARTLVETGGAAIAGASSANPVFAFFEHLFNFLLLGLTVIFGLRPPWSARFLALPLAPLALALNTALLIFMARRTARAQDAARGGRWLLLGVCVTLVAAFLLTPFGADPSGRYFLPLAAPLALFMAERLHEWRVRRFRGSRVRGRRSSLDGWLVNGLALALIAFNVWGTAQSAAAFPPGLTTQFNEVTQIDQRDLGALMAFLRAQGETRGYTNYWVAYPLAFLSDEELIYEPRLPYHLDFRYTPRDNRYLPYARAVAASARAAYITTRHPALDERLRAGLSGLGVTFSEKWLGDFHVFYALSRKVRPEEMGLGVACCGP